MGRAAAQCQCAAAAQGRGEAFAALALANVAEIEGPADYVDLAEHLGLDEEAVAEALFDGTYADAVRDDHDAGRELGVRGTPTFVVDGLMVHAGATREGALESLVARIERARPERQPVSRTASAGSTGCRAENQTASGPRTGRGPAPTRRR